MKIIAQPNSRRDSEGRHFCSVCGTEFELDAADVSVLWAKLDPTQRGDLFCPCPSCHNLVWINPWTK